jgi:hypothetical protein
MRRTRFGKNVLGERNKNCDFSITIQLQMSVISHILIGCGSFGKKLG